MTIKERLIVIETKQKNLERLIYGIYILLAANFGVNLI